MSLPDFLNDTDRLPPTISKTRYMAGAQCEKKLYMEVFESDKAAEEEEMDKTIQELGHKIHRLAKERYPDGEEVELNPGNIGPAVVRTRELMADENVKAIFEATLISGGEQASVDILERKEDGTWDMVEVKSSSKMKKEYALDVAMQYRVFKNAGVNVGKVRLLQPNKAFVLSKEDIDPMLYFMDTDVTETVKAKQDDTDQRLTRQKAILSQMTSPQVKTGSHCKDPRTCAFHDHCHRNLEQAEYPIESLYKISKKMIQTLKDAGIHDIRDVPFDFKGLSPKQLMQMNVLRDKKPFHDAEKIEEALAGLKFPVSFLDFETIIPGIPLYPGTKPYEIIPIQFSSHTLIANGRTYHKEFLHALDTDPRERFIKNLLKAVKTEGSIVVYSAYEANRLKSLGDAFPQHKEALDAVMARFVDLLPIVQEHTYYAEYKGSYSLKAVLPVFVKKTELSYESLAIKNGNEASVAFLEMIDSETAPIRKMEISLSLRRYCATDTEALLRLFYQLAPNIASRLMSGPKKSAKTVKGQKKAAVI